MGHIDNSRAARETPNEGGTAASAAEAVRASRSWKRRTPSRAQAILLASALGQLALALAVTAYLARILSPAAFGFFSLVGSIFILARKFLDLGLSNVAARDVAGDPQRERPILEGMMAYRRIAGVALMLALAIFAFLQTSPVERWVLILTGVVLLFTAPAALDPVFQVRQAQGGPALLNIFGGLLILGGSVVFERFALAGAAFALLLVIREAISLFVTKIMGERLLGYHPSPGIRGRNLREFVGPALIFGLASLVYTIYFNCDVFFVYAMRGQKELGAYAAAFRPINPLLLLPWLLMLPMVPVLTATIARDREGFIRQVQSASGIAMGIGMCGSAAGFLLAPDLVYLLYRGNYLEGVLSCVNAFRWLAVALGLVCVTTVITASLLAMGKEKRLLQIGVAALIANAALNLLLLRHYNFTAAGFATAVTELFYLLASLIAFQSAAGRSAVAKKSFVFLIPAMIMTLILQFLHGTPPARVTIGVVLGLLSLAAILSVPSSRRFRQEIAGRSVIADQATLS